MTDNSLSPLADLESQTTFAMRKAYLVLQRDIAAKLRPLNLTPEAFYVLCALHRAPDLTPSVLAALVDVRLANLQGLLQRLETSGLVNYQLPVGRRSRPLRLTELGEEARRNALRVWFEHNERAGRAIANAGDAEFNSVLARLARLHQPKAGLSSE